MKTATHENHILELNMQHITNCKVDIATEQKKSILSHSLKKIV